MTNEEEEPEEQNFLWIYEIPQVQKMLISQISSLFDPYQKVTHVAGIEKPETVTNENESDNEKSRYDAIERLKKHDDQLVSDLVLLWEMAETDKMQFKFLIKM